MLYDSCRRGLLAISTESFPSKFQLACCRARGSHRRRQLLISSMASDRKAKLARTEKSKPAEEHQGPKLMDFTSRRSPVLGTRGMVSCTQPLASEVSQHICNLYFSVGWPPWVDKANTSAKLKSTRRKSNAKPSMFAL